LRRSGCSARSAATGADDGRRELASQRAALVPLAGVVALRFDLHREPTGALRLAVKVVPEHVLTDAAQPGQHQPTTSQVLFRALDDRVDGLLLATSSHERRRLSAGTGSVRVADQIHLADSRRL